MKTPRWLVGLWVAVGLLNVAGYYVLASDRAIEKQCNQDRVWNLICGPLCGLPPSGQAGPDDLHALHLNCFERCAAATETPDELKTTMAIHSFEKTGNCIDEVKHGWHPPTWLMRQLSINLNRVNDKPLLNPSFSDPSVWETPRGDK